MRAFPANLKGLKFWLRVVEEDGKVYLRVNDYQRELTPDQVTWHNGIPALPSGVVPRGVSLEAWVRGDVTPQ